MALLSVLVVYSPGEGLPLCGFHWLTSYSCPLCGLTRGMAHLVKGHWRVALEYHALSPLVLVVMLAWSWFRIPWAHVAVLFLGYGVGRAFLRNSAMSVFN
jgi:hypothetical protein